MATKNANDTIIVVVCLGAACWAVWKFWKPAKKALAGSGSGGAGGAGGAGFYPNRQQQGQGSGSSLGGNMGGSQGNNSAQKNSGAVGNTDIDNDIPVGWDQQVGAKSSPEIDPDTGLTYQAEGDNYFKNNLPPSADVAADIPYSDSGLTALSGDADMTGAFSSMYSSPAVLSSDASDLSNPSNLASAAAAYNTGGYLSPGETPGDDNDLGGDYASLAANALDDTSYGSYSNADEGGDIASFDYGDGGVSGGGGNDFDNGFYDQIDQTDFGD